MSLTNNEAWYDKAFVSIAPKNGSDVELRTHTTSLKISGGDFDIEGLETFAGKIKRVGSKNDMEISFDGIPTSVQDFDWIFHGTTSDATSITTSDVVDYRLIFLWTDQAVSSAGSAINSSSEAYRQIYANANCTNIEYNMDAGDVLKATLTFKLPVEDESGSSNIKKEMCDTSSTLTAVSPYTSTTKW